MLAPKIPDNEAQRIAALHELLVLDTPPESRFDNITAYAASQFSVPIALISLVDSERLWLKSTTGMERVTIARETGFCGHAILHSGVFEIPDASQDVRFADNPLVLGEPYIIFYAGAPLIMNNGEAVGTLCLIDQRPHRLDEWEREHLIALAGLVARELQGESVAGELARLQKIH